MSLRFRRRCRWIFTEKKSCILSFYIITGLVSNSVPVTSPSSNGKPSVVREDYLKGIHTILFNAILVFFWRHPEEERDKCIHIPPWVWHFTAGRSAVLFTRRWIFNIMCPKCLVVLNVESWFKITVCHERQRHNDCCESPGTFTLDAWSHVWMNRNVIELCRIDTVNFFSIYKYWLNESHHRLEERTHQVSS